MNPSASLLQNRRIKTIVLGEWLQKARAQLRHFPEVSISSVYALIGYVLNKPVHIGLSHPEILLSPSNEKELYVLFHRLLAGEPLPYLIGKQEFFGIDFNITSAVLIPRPETELMVEVALEWLKQKKSRNLIADVGTGSGCISVAISKHLSYVSIIGTDLSFQALRVAKENIRKYDLEKQVHLVQANLLAGLAGPFDCICANLPYIPTETLSTLSVRKYEPLSALEGGEDGLKFIEPFLKQAKKVVTGEGLMLLEIESTLSSTVFDLASFVFRDASITIHNDLAGLPRLVQIIMNGK